MTTRFNGAFFVGRDSNDNLVPGGRVYTYVAGTSDPLVTYDADGNSNTNPVILDGAGQAVIVLDGNYRIVFRNAADDVTYFDEDGIESETLSEWINEQSAAFVSGTTFTLANDQTANYEVDRGVRINNNPSLAYSIPTSVSYSVGTNLTTIVLQDSVVTSGIINASTSIVGPTSKITQSLINTLAASGGAATIGTTSGTVQSNIIAINAAIDALDFQPYNALLDVPVGGRRTGSDGNLYKALIANGPATTVVDPVGDVTGTWEQELNDTLELPVGVPVPWPLGTPPTNFFECDGSAFSTSTYPLLFAAYPTGTLPDLRADFIRGWDNGRGVDSGRAIYTFQGHQFGAHSHTVSNMNELETGSGSFTQGGGGSGQGALSTDSAGGGETRPRNTSFMYIVRAA